MRNVTGRFGMMLWSAGMVLLASFLEGCSASAPRVPRGAKFQYDYKLILPQESPSLTFKDDSISVRFKIDDAAINFGLENASRSSLVIDWTKATIGVNRVFTNVRNNTNFYGDANDRPMSAVIPSRGIHGNLAIPIENMMYSRGRWVERDLLLTMDGNNADNRDAILENVGKNVILTLPMQFGKAQKEYTFIFRVTGVREIDWKDYRVPKRSAPPLRRRTSQFDQVTAAIVTVGVLGFTAFLISSAKDPRTD